MKQLLLDKIAKKEIAVGVIGMGYVGLPLAVEKAKAGFKTIGFDEQSIKVDMVNQGHNYIGDVVDKDLKRLVEEGMLSATSDFSFIKDVDFIAICVPTPLDIHQEPDLSCVRDSTASISKYLKKNTMVVLESTTYPGTTEELVRPILEEGSGLIILGSPRSWWTRAICFIRRKTRRRLWAVSEGMPQRSSRPCTARCWRGT